jgi:hypothetical protein
LYKRKPNVKYLKTFGCVAHAKRVGPGVTNLADRSVPMVFIGYEHGTKGYNLFDPVAQKLDVSRDVIFEESKAWDCRTQSRQTQLHPSLKWSSTLLLVK